MATTTTTTTLSTSEANQLNSLRAELKQWEKAFADANGGRKAGRHDIKQDPSIAAKYKTYGRLRALEESSASTQNVGGQEKTPSESNHRTKRKITEVNDTADNKFTPRKAPRGTFTPSRNTANPHHPATIDPYDSPSTFRRLFSPSTHRQLQQPSPLPLKTAIGPTPQRNGKILGLFDMLSASGGSTATPSANRIATLDHAIAQTPSRRKPAPKLDDIPESADNEKEEDEYELKNLMGRTPASSSKKMYLERLFATPTTLRFATMMEEEDNQPQRILYQKAETGTQTDVKHPLGSETPSFLRRWNSGRYVSSSNDNDPANPFSPVGVRKFQRYNGKRLTALVQGLRDMENERMEDDWDILNEIEAERNGPALGIAGEGENVQVGDSQMPQVDAGDENLNGGKVWKKKGQKRTTRLVKMKPVMQVKNKPMKQSKRTQEKEVEDEIEDDLQPIVDPESVDIDDNLRRTRNLRERKQSTETDQQNADEEDEYSDDNSSDSDFTETAPSKQPIPSTTIPKPTSSFSEKLKAAFSTIPVLKKNTKKPVTKKDEDDKQKASPKKRKVNPDAHANYRSLKIRSKGQGRFGRGRFGRR
ncbi:conserved hypothetical protein [Talaromyces stipitatus ATCC 10500]|uniref:DNA replication regulator SLD2 n=1 Tax=Talaromyces stipitatus (strain ATCC 10500 / CBS 375.48 / QM 6759 / NRRL 1006) TaxID=441959 RepID=B8MKI0_TALSN|nr:uncharacterized protein TSTA_047810 [Talaromyces stipitatus ATCC 10500]EED15335.1 conserved hypothetical protein [Talaromyces stipitatus ATCC 10500]